MRDLCYHGYLDGRSQQLAKPSRCSIRPWIRRRCQIEHNPRLRCRVCTQEHPRRLNNDVADVDRLRYHVGLRIVCGLPKNHHFRREHTMALDDGFYVDPAFHRHGSGLSLPRKSSLVSESQAMQ